MVLGGRGGSHDWSQGGGGVLGVVLGGVGGSYEWSQGGGGVLMSGPRGMWGVLRVVLGGWGFLSASRQRDADKVNRESSSPGFVPSHL